MKILYIGDIMGQAGIDVVGKILLDLRREKQIDLVIAQSENVTNGKGMSPGDMKTLQGFGIDFFTGGNWSLHNKALLPLLADSNQPVTRPANYPEGTPGSGVKYVQSSAGKVLVITLLGAIVGKDSDNPTDNVLQTIDKILEDNKGMSRVATVVNFHGDYSSEKRVIGYYLDGRVSAVVGDHWHVPTADAMILPNGTAHITDVGMCGTLHSSLGVKLDSIIPRWREGIVNKNVLETAGPFQFNSVLIDVNTQTGLANSIVQIQKVF